jgi:hypothetical protein
MNSISRNKSSDPELKAALEKIAAACTGTVKKAVLHGTVPMPRREKGRHGAGSVGTRDARAGQYLETEVKSAF